MESITAELYVTYKPLTIPTVDKDDAISAHFDQDRFTGEFVEEANGIARVLSRMGRRYGLKALRGRLLYGLCEDRSRKRVPAKESGNGTSVDGPFLGVPLSRILPQETSVNGEV